MFSDMFSVPVLTTVNKILTSLPLHQVTYFTYINRSTPMNDSSSEFAFQKHLTTLREISIQSQGQFFHRISSASTILKECVTLEILYVGLNYDVGHYHPRRRCGVPKGCAKLTHHILPISRCFLLDNNDLDLLSMSYFARPSPITLVDAEQYLFSRLDYLYRQISTLTNLQYLELEMAPFLDNRIYLDEKKDLVKRGS